VSRSVRMFEIIQLLRSAGVPMTAQRIAEALEVTKRTVYRDIGSLQAMRVPIVAGSLIDVAVRLERPATRDELAAAFAADGAR